MPIGEEYIPNDVALCPQRVEDRPLTQIIIITGPNMAGKSALLRQTALIVLLAQIGCYVPADSAHIGLVDKIFTRVGASDSLSTGESTFMVEMTEAANILNNLSPNSLVLFDELGRGTSTYDGISIAWAIVEHLHDAPAPPRSSLPPHPRTLFATHYHELNQLEHFFPRVKNYNVAVSQSQGTISFLHTLQRGPSAHSFGIHVAQMAGMPKSIIRRANTILQQLEQGNSQIGSSLKPSSESTGKPQKDLQLSFFQLDDPVLSQVRDEILHLDIDTLTPVQALNKLNEIKKIVSGK
jgi:DNA mismatch repair protein MutS